MRGLRPTDVLLCYDGSFEGFLSLVFHAYATCCMPRSIAPGRLAQPALGQAVVTVPTDLRRAERVRAGLGGRAGVRCYEKVLEAFLSCEEGRELALLAYVEHAMAVGRRVHGDLANPLVAPVEAYVRSVGNECEKVRQFARFEELEGGVFFARVNPKASVVPLVMGHFVERFNVQPFILHDEIHHVAGLYDGRHVSLVFADRVELPARAAGERDCQRLWKAFYDAAANKQRHNPALRRSFMPERLWRNITELQAPQVTGR